MLSRLRSTLRGAFWTAFFRRIRHCYVCGGALTKKHVKAEGKRRLVCDACGEITYLNPKVVAGLIPVLADGRIALLRRDIEPAKGKWTYPAGFQELGETVAEAAARETWEEIRTRLTAERMLGVYSYADAGVVTIVYVGRVPKDQKPRAGEESQEVQLFSPSELPWDEMAFRSTTEALKDYLASRSNNGARPAPRRTLSRRTGVDKPRS